MDWVPLGELAIGEQVYSNDGPLHLVARTAHNQPTDVYNIEVDCEHVYQVGSAGILVHNACNHFKKYDVYVSYHQSGSLKGKVEYVGITSNLGQRSATHRRDSSRTIVSLKSGLGYRQARALEHVLIHRQLDFVTNIQKGISVKSLGKYKAEHFRDANLIANLLGL